MKKNWDPNRVERLKEFRENLHSRAGSRYEGSWSLGTNAKNRGTEAQGEKKKRMGKKERAKLKAMQSEKDEEEETGNGNVVRPEVEGQSQKRKRDSDVVSHPREPPPDVAGRCVEDSAPKKKRRRRHKKGSGEAGAMVVS